jgi:hypothetical protein
MVKLEKLLEKLLKIKSIFYLIELEMEITKENSVYFEFCSNAVKNGCKNSRDLEKLLVRNFADVFIHEAERIVRVWNFNREKIDSLKTQNQTLIIKNEH